MVFIVNEWGRVDGSHQFVTAKGSAGFILSDHGRLIEATNRLVMDRKLIILLL
jgi:hypothetical protein